MRRYGNFICSNVRDRMQGKHFAKKMKRADLKIEDRTMVLAGIFPRTRERGH
jgi:hypothetical protein